MTWEAHAPHKISAENWPFYTYTLVGKGGENYYAAFVVQNADGFKATTPDLGDDPMPHHYTHDTLQDAKDWCIAELWRRRLENT
jgi:hypothetical protein